MDGAQRAARLRGSCGDTSSSGASSGEGELRRALASGERIAGRPALLLELEDGGGICLTTLGLGTFNEIAEILQARILGQG